MILVKFLHVRRIGHRTQAICSAEGWRCGACRVGEGLLSEMAAVSLEDPAKAAEVEVEKIPPVLFGAVVRQQHKWQVCCQKPASRAFVLLFMLSKTPWASTLASRLGALSPLVLCATVLKLMLWIRLRQDASQARLQNCGCLMLITNTLAGAGVKAVLSAAAAGQ